MRQNSTAAWAVLTAANALLPFAQLAREWERSEATHDLIVRRRPGFPENGLTVANLYAASDALKVLAGTAPGLGIEIIGLSDLALDLEDDNQYDNYEVDADV